MKGKLKTIEGIYRGEKIKRYEIEEHCCDNCEKEFSPVLPHSPGTIMPKHALEMSFHPYYGGYFDQGGPEEDLEQFAYRYFWFCEECAEKLFDAFPCMKIKSSKEARAEWDERSQEAANDSGSY